MVSNACTNWLLAVGRWAFDPYPFDATVAVVLRPVSYCVVTFNAFTPLGDGSHAITVPGKNHAGMILATRVRATCNSQTLARYPHIAKDMPPPGMTIHIWSNREL